MACRPILRIVFLYCALQTNNAQLNVMMRKTYERRCILARINLSISDDLKERMDQLPGVNWSKVAQDTFETHVQINELKGKNMTTEAGLARLRASKQSNGEAEHAEGVAVGKQWAIDVAEHDELKRVAALAEVDYDVGAMDLTAAIEDDGQPSWNDMGDCMESTFGTRDPSTEIVNGFIEGAAEVFAQV